MTEDKIEAIKTANRKMIGKRVYVVDGRGFYAFVVDIKDLDKFIVDENGQKHEVSIFSVRSVD